MRMVEKVARALFAREGMIYTDDERMFEPYPFEELDEIERAGFMDRASAAIEAMREPDDEMVKAGVEFALSATVSGDGGWPLYVAEKHRAMIDKAIQESGE